MPLAVLRAKDFEHAPRYELWTDALCFREMAKNPPDNYLQSMCIRNAVISACTTLEMACKHALELKRLKGPSFQASLEKALQKHGKPAIDFTSEPWHDVLKIRESRNDYAHSGVTLADRFPPISIAEDAIKKIREAIQDIYGMMSKSYPKWVDFDQVEGWPQRQGGMGISASFHATVLHQGAHPDLPDVIKIVLETEQGEEKPTRYLPPDSSNEEIFYWVEDYWHRAHADSQRLATIPGIGPVTASAILAAIGDGKQFRSAREFAAWIGLVPRQNSSGGKERLGRISKRGNIYLRQLLVMGATGQLRKRRDRTPWFEQLVRRKSARVASVALANKMARIAWAVLTKGEKYRPPVVANDTVVNVAA